MDKRPFRRGSPRPSKPDSEVLTEAAYSPSPLPRFRQTTDGFTRNELVNAFRNSFQLIGGIDALTIWAADNQTEFYKLFSKLFPAATITLGDTQALIIQHAIPPTMLDQHPQQRLEAPLNEHADTELCAEATLRSVPPEE